MKRNTLSVLIIFFTVLLSSFACRRNIEFYVEGIILVFSLQGVMAQKGQLEREPIYYLFDSISTPIKDRMWEIQREGNDIA